MPMPSLRRGKAASEPAEGAPEARLCPSCRAKVGEKAVYCPDCGVKLSVAEREARRRAAGKAPNPKRAARALARSTGREPIMTTNDLVGFELMHEDGVAELPGGRFSQTLEFQDASYEGERRDVRDDIYDKWQQLHASMPTSCVYTINLVNFPEDRAAASRRAQLAPVVGECAELAREYNRIVERKQREGRRDLRRRNFLTYSVAASDLEGASSQLAALRESVTKHFGRLQVSVAPLDGQERMSVLHKLIRGDEEPFLFSYERLACRGRARDYLAPTWAAYPDDDRLLRRKIIMPGHQVKVLHIRDFGSELSDRAIRLIRSLPIPMSIALTFAPQPKSKTLKAIRNNINVTQAEIQDMQTKMSAAGVDFTRLPPALEEKEEEGRELLSFIREEDQILSHFQGLITVYAKSDAEMERYVRLIVDEAQAWSVDVVELPTYQEDAFVSGLPLARTRLEGHFRSLATSEAAIMVPFAAEEVYHDPKRSFFFGAHGTSLAPLFLSPDELKSPHTMIYGMTGSGKGMIVESILTWQQLMWPRTAESPDPSCAAKVCADPCAPQWFVFDMHGEYRATGEALGGTVTSFGPAYENRLNPFDLGDGNGELSMKEVRKNTDFFLALAQDVMDRGLSKQEEGMISRCMGIVYEPHVGTTGRPTLSDFYDALVAQGDEVGEHIAAAFESYSIGLMNCFDGATNVADSPYLNIYDCSELGRNLQTLALLSMLQHVRNATFANHRVGRPTYVVVEEFQVLFSNPAAVNLLDSFFGELRKFGLHMICVTQHPTRVLEHPIAKHLYENTGLLVFLPMQVGNAEMIADTFALSSSQRDCIDARTDPGKGLIIADGMKIPFNSRIDAGIDKRLYELWNTDADKYARREGAEEE